MFAVAAIEYFCECCPEQAPQLNWLLTPRRRHVLLTELGRVAQPKSDEHGVLHWNDDDVVRLIHAALEISELKPTTKAGVTLIRDLRRRYRLHAA